MYMPDRDFSLKTYALFIFMAGSLLAVMTLNLPMPTGVAAYLDGSGLKAAEVSAELPADKGAGLEANLIDEHSHRHGDMVHTQSHSHDDTVSTHSHGQGGTVYTHSHRYGGTVHTHSPRRP